MQKIMQANIHAVDIFALEQLAVIRVGMGDLILLCNALHFILADIAYSHDFCFGDFRILLQMVFSNLSSTDDTDSHFVTHGALLIDLSAREDREKDFNGLIMA